MNTPNETTKENWRDIVCEWLSTQTYVGDYDRDNLESVCLDGYINIETLAISLLSHQRTALLDKVEEMIDFDYIYELKRVKNAELTVNDFEEYGDELKTLLTNLKNEYE